MAVAVPPAGETRFTALVDALREAILTGRYPAGTRLVQEELAAAFGVSRIPLREALRRLEGEGLVAIAANRGAIVRPLSPKDVVDLFDLRLALESLAVRRAAERYADLRAATRARGIEARRAAASGGISTLFHLDRDFHAALAAASQNAQLIAVLDGLWSQIMRLMHAYLRSANYPEGVWDDHEAIAAAVAHGDGEHAAALVRAHLEGSRDLILARLRENDRANAAAV